MSQLDPKARKSFKVTIIGDGAMATVCAMQLHNNGHAVTIWSAFEQYAAAMAQRRENFKYLPGFHIPPGIQITAATGLALSEPQIIINAVPCQYMREVWQGLAGQVPGDALYASVTKGIENKTLLRPSCILTELLGKVTVVAVSGPSIALEVARSLPATIVAACKQIAHARTIQQLFSSQTLRVYANNDIVGVELAGATKNIIAIAAGMIDGLGIGDNAKAAVLTRGLVEITRLGVALGARPETFAGLAGLGDLVTTCISPHGRNRTLGEKIGRGMKLQQAQASISSVVEGVATTASVVQLAKKHHTEMPITQAIYAIMFEDKDPRAAIRQLMTRQPKDEF